MGLTEESEEMDNELDVWVCECCALLILNGDDAGCRDYYGHTHPVCDGSVTYADLDNVRKVGYFHEICDGCGVEMLSYDTLYAATRG